MVDRALGQQAGDGEMQPVPVEQLGHLEPVDRAHPDVDPGRFGLQVRQQPRQQGDLDAVRHAKDEGPLRLGRVEAALLQRPLDRGQREPDRVGER